MTCDDVTTKCAAVCSQTMIPVPCGSATCLADLLIICSRIIPCVSYVDHVCTEKQCFMHSLPFCYWHFSLLQNFAYRCMHCCLGTVVVNIK